MPVLVNFKICDNSPECNGIYACPTGAFHFDRKKETIVIDENLCIECGKCACCPAGAIHYAKDESERKRIKKEIEDDPRRVEDLFVNRYGATVLPDFFVIEENAFEKEVENYPGRRVCEIVTEDSIECLVHSIPIKKVLERHREWRYRKMLLKDMDIVKKYNISVFTCLLFFEKGIFIGKVEGYYDDSQIKEFQDEIDNIVNIKSKK